MVVECTCMFRALDFATYPAVVYVFYRITPPARMYVMNISTSAETARIQPNKRCILVVFDVLGSRIFQLTGARDSIVLEHLLAFLACKHCAQPTGDDETLAGGYPTCSILGYSTNVTKRHQIQARW